MAKRPCYRPLERYVGYRTVESPEFTWHPGFAFSQKQKNVVALHDAIHRIDPSAKVLEISSKSLQPLGVSLSAFNLKFPHGGVECSVESVFQASKVFDGGVGPFPELYSHDSREVRHHVQEASAGHRLLALKLAEELREFDAFTDIEFNPNRQINCQAAAAAFYVSLCRIGKLEEAISSREAFLRML